MPDVDKMKEYSSERDKNKQHRHRVSDVQDNRKHHRRRTPDMVSSTHRRHHSQDVDKKRKDKLRQLHTSMDADNVRQIRHPAPTARLLEIDNSRQLSYPPLTSVSDKHHILDTYNERTSRSSFPPPNTMWYSPRRPVPGERVGWRCSSPEKRWDSRGRCSGDYTESVQTQESLGNLVATWAEYCAESELRH